MESYAAGELEPALIEETIGANFERTVAAHGDSEALVEVASGRRWTYAELDRDVNALARGPDRRRHREGRPGRGVGAQLRRVDDRAVRQRQGRRDPGQRQPVLPHPRVLLRGQPVRAAAADRGAVVQDQRLPGDGRGGPWPVPGPGPGRLHRHRRLGRAGRRRGVGCRQDAVAERMATLDPDDPINIQYTSGTTGYPKGATLSHRNILNNGYFTTELINFAPDDRLCIPVPFYHCFGMVMAQPRLHHPRRHDGDPGARLRPRDHPARDRRGAVHRGVRRADDVHRDAEPPVLRRARPLHAAHRDHGRLDLPGRGDEALRQRHEHDRGVDRLRHDRDLAGLLPDPRRRRPRPSYRHDRAGAPARRDQDRRPGDRRDRRAWAARRVLHPRLLGDARLLGRPREDRRGHRRGRLDAHR